METTANSQKSYSLKELTELVLQQQAQIEALQAKLTPVKADTKEMTDDHARQILNGDLRSKTHRECEKELGLTYGQIYSCRGKYTFKHIHKELAQVEGYTNIWAK